MMRPRPFLAACLALLAASAAGCASESADDDAAVDDGARADQAAALIGGEIVSPAQFPATVFLVQRKCTAAKVAPRVFLTAAHCVWQAISKQPTLAKGDVLGVTRDPSKDPTGTQVTVTDVLISPEWQAACTAQACVSSDITAKLDAADVAIIKTETDIADVKVAPIEDRPLARGDRVIVLGYGCEKGVQGERPKIDERRLKFSETSVISPTATVHVGSPIARPDVPTVAASYTVTGGPGLVRAKAGLCPGDSGGPVYRWRGSQLVVVGVNSTYTFAPDDLIGMPVTNFHTRLDDQSKHFVARWLRANGAMP
jgi:secreted trypsin-like serine protease